MLCVVPYLQVMMILHLCKMPRHKCPVVCDGIDSANRVSLILVFTSAVSSLSHCVEKQYIFLPDCPLVCSSALFPQIAHECRYSDEAFDTL